MKKMPTEIRPDFQKGHDFLRPVVARNELINREKALSKSEERFRDFAEAASDWLWEMDADLLFTYGSPRFFVTSGFEPGDVYGQSRIFFINPDLENIDGGKWRRHFWQLKNHEPFRNMEYRTKNKKGEIIHISINGKPIYSPVGEFAGYRGTGTEVTERKQVEEVLQETKAQLEIAIDSFSDGFVLFDSNDRFVFANDACLDSHPELRKIRLPGMKFEQIVRKVAAVGFYGNTPEGTEKYAQSRIKFFRSGKPFEYRMDNGRWYEMTEYKTRDSGIALVRREITKRKQVENALRESEGKFRLVVDNMPVLMAYVDADERYRLNNKMYEEWFSESESEINGSKVRDVVGETVYRAVHGYIEKALSGERVTFESQGPRKDGAERHVRGTYVPHIDSDGKVLGYFSMTLDITERKQAEKALMSSKERFKTLAESSPDGIFHTDTDGFATYANPRWEEISGLSATDTLGKGWMRAIHPEDRKRLHHDRRESAASNKRWITEGRILRPDGEVRWASFHVGPQLDKAGNPLSFVGTVTDITERMNMEEELRKSLVDAERAYEAKSEFLASMSHELRTPLNAVIGFSQMLQIDPKNPLTSAQNTYVESILDGGNRLLDLVTGILDLTMIEANHLDLSLEEVNANEVVADCVTLAMPLGQLRGIEFVDHFSGLPAEYLQTDRARLKQALINLLSNAIKFNKEGGTVTVEGRVTDCGFLRLSVTDTGIGISEDDFPSIFQVFQRLDANPKVAREGTGIGLTVTKLLVEHMAGQVGFESKDCVGSTFWFELPLASNDEVIIWSDNLRIGVDAVDKDHQILLSLLNRAAHGDVNDTVLAEVIEKLVDYTRYHFRREEAIMAVCGYPDLEKHRGLHRTLTTQVEDLVERWRKDPSSETLHYLRKFLRHWLIRHIGKEDAKISQYTKWKERDIVKALKYVD